MKQYYCQMLAKMWLLVIFLLILNSCHRVNKHHQSLNEADTMQIVSKVFSSKSFIAENGGVDTLFIFKNKYYNHAWPAAIAKFKLVSIADNARNRMLNVGPGFPMDPRLRLSIRKFSYQNDTCQLVILENGSNLSYESKLVFQNKKWVLAIQKIQTGPRMEEFEFSNEVWYKNWKKQLEKKDKSQYY